MSSVNSIYFVLFYCVWLSVRPKLPCCSASHSVTPSAAEGLSVKPNQLYGDNGAECDKMPTLEQIK